MNPDKEGTFRMLTQYGMAELGGLKYSDWRVIQDNENVHRLVEQLASEIKRLEKENKQILEEYEEVKKQRNDLVYITTPLKEKLESHTITIPVDIKLRFVDGC